MQRVQKHLSDGALAGETHLASPVSPITQGTPLPTVRPTDSAGGGPEVLTAYWNASEVAAPVAGAPFQFEQAFHNGATNLSWSEADRTKIIVEADGIIFAYARLLVSAPPAGGHVYSIKNDGLAFGAALLPEDVQQAAGGGFHQIELTDFTTGDVLLYNDATGVTPVTAQLTVVLYAGGFTLVTG